jgi:phenylacetaldehyde dehydrogenase
MELNATTKAFMTQRHRNLIGGEWTPAASGKCFEICDPSTEECLGQAADSDKEDVNRAVAAARKAFDHGPWTKMSPAERGCMIWKLADLIEKHCETFAQLETLDNGKPYKVACAADVPLAVEQFRYYAGWATKIEGNTIPMGVPYAPGAEFHAFTWREPIGVVAQIIPWNFPLLMAAWKLAPALAAGNTVVLKPAEQTPMSALFLGQLIAEAGFPPGVVNIVTGFGESAGAPLAWHPQVDKVAFTGSTEVGKLIVGAAQSNLKKVTLELGGKSPNFIFADCDHQAAFAGAASAIFFNQGQCCCAGSRLFIEDSIFDKAVAEICDMAKKIKVGPGFDPSCHMGPLVSAEQMHKVCGYMEHGANEGAKVLTGGRRVGSKGFFVEPTVMVNTNNQMKVVREEIFGPVVVAMPFSSKDDMSALACCANDTSYGLAAGIWTKDISKAHRLAKMIKAGTVWVNCYNVFDAALPFGGYKESGWGREMGHAALDAYTQTKSVCIQL